MKKNDLIHSQNNLQIDFFGLDFRAGESLRYQYKIEGADADWSNPSLTRSINLANLSPGNYRLLIVAVTSEGIKSENPAVFTFRISPPFWARWWFILAVIILTVFIIILIYRYRTAKLRQLNTALSEANRAEEAIRKLREERIAELEKVRTRIANDLHDDIGSSLTQIAILSEVAQAQSKNGASEHLRAISSVSNELVGTMSDIVWSINPAKDQLADLTQRMRRFASDVLTARGISLHFFSPEADENIVLGTNLRREVFLIFKESVNNIVKHSKATETHIQLQISGEFLVLQITDNGIGFEFDGYLQTKNSNLVNDEFGGNGVINMYKRAFEMQAEFQIDSNPEKGTKIFLKFPLENATRSGGDSVQIKT